MLADFYRSKEWEQLRRRLMLERVNAEGFIICAHCGKPIIKKYDCIGHHLEELTESNYRDANISLNPDNIALVHHKCHNEIHEKTGCKQKKVYIIWGSPMSGKNTYVQGVAKYGDLILDIDNLWQAISGRPRYEKPNRIKENVFSLHNQVLTMIAQRMGYWNVAYVIGGYALPSERERLAQRLGAECVYIDTTREECLARLAMCQDGRKKTEWEKYISDWWYTFERFAPPPGA
jgi:predicted kinase